MKAVILAGGLGSRMSEETHLKPMVEVGERPHPCRSEDAARSPMFSMIVPAFNAESTLARCIASIACQTEAPPFEIIIVDDGSSDKTVEIATALAYADPRILVLKTTSNGGPGVARNLGVEHARGDWVCFADADDLLEPGYFSALETALGDGSPDLDILAFNAVLVDALTGNTLKKVIRIDLGLVRGPNRVTDYLQDRIDRSVIHYSFRRSFLLENRIVFRAGLHEDVDYTFHALLQARRVSIVDRPLYRKIDTPNSIINSLSRRHINGFFDALDTILELAVREARWEQCRQPYLTGIINVTATRLVALISSKVNKLEETGEILLVLHRRVKQTFAKAGFMQPLPIQARGFRTKYRIIFDTFLDAMRCGEPINNLIEKITDLMSKSWSCYDLHHSIFLGPGEIRTCCKRYTHEGRLKGDVVLLRGDSENFSFTYDDIRQAKNNLHLEINRDNSDDCQGCPFLRFENWGTPLDQGVKYLSFEHHSLCNMRCTYCSEIYYGGRKPTYDVSFFIENLKQKDALRNIEYIVWGGGEPTVDPAFPAQARKLADGITGIKQRIISNATLYSETLSTLLREDRALMVTSIDAGNEKSFNSIRNYNNFNKVIENIKRYAEKGSHNIVLKYILLPENSSFEELSDFSKIIIQHGLSSCNFQISCNFKSNHIDIHQLASIIYLHHLLQELGVRYIFLDDLIWQRLLNISPEILLRLKEQLGNDVYSNTIQPIPKSGVVIWGTGGQAQLMQQKSNFFRHAKIAYYVDPRESTWGKTLDEIEIRPPTSLLENDLPVFIAAVQSTPQILDQFEAMGLPRSRLIRKLVL